MPRPKLKLALSVRQTQQNLFEPFTKQEIINYYKTLEPKQDYPHLFGRSADPLTQTQKLLLIDYIIKTQFPNAREQTLSSRGGSGGGKIVYDEHYEKILKYIINPLSWENEKTVAERINKLDLPFPNVVAIYSSIQTIVYQNKFPNGVTLDKFAWTNEQQKKIVAGNLITALQDIHKKGVVHGDIKPQNILVDPETLNIQFIDLGSGQFYDASKMYDLRGTTLSKLPQRLYRHSQAKKLAELTESVTWDEKIALDVFALATILKELGQPNQQFQRMGNTAAQAIIQRNQDVVF
jgi:tRNA A-37 threonylcarbamoyl transferase component Bud32